MRYVFEEPKQIRDIFEAAEAGRDDLIPLFLQSEEEFQKIEARAVWFAVRGGQALFIKKIREYAKGKGWYESKAAAFLEASTLAVQDRFFCMQILALHDRLFGAHNNYTDLFFLAGEGHSRHLNQCLLTLLALIGKPELMKHFASAALMGALGYDNLLNYQRIELLLELGASPHSRRKINGKLQTLLSLSAGALSYFQKENPNYASPLSLLLTALNSKTINGNKEYYIKSVRAYFSEEIKARKNRAKMSENDLTAFALAILEGKAPEIKSRDGSGFLHWAAASGHDELLDDIIDSFHAHKASSLMYLRDASGNTPLTCAIEAGHFDIADRLLIKAMQSKNDELEDILRQNNLADRTYILNWIGSKEIRENFDYYHQSLIQFFNIGSPLSKTFSSLMKWAEAEENVKILPDVIRCYEKHGISTQPIPRAPHFSHLSSQILKSYQQKVLSGEMDVAQLETELTPVLLEKLEELKPNCRMVQMLDLKYHSVEGKTPFMVMCENNEIALVRRLVPFLTYEDILMLDLYDGNNPLHLACAAGAIEVVQFLQEKYSREMLKQRNKEGLISILCAGLPERQAIFESDKSGEFLKLFSEELLLNIISILELPIPQLKKTTGFFARLTFASDHAKELEESKKAVESYKFPEIIPLLIERLSVKVDGQYNFHLLQAANNNAVLRATLGLSYKDLNNELIRNDYGDVLIAALNRLNSEFSPESNRLDASN